MRAAVGAALLLLGLGALATPLWYPLLRRRLDRNRPPARHMTPVDWLSATGTGVFLAMILIAASQALRGGGGP